MRILIFILCFSVATFSFSQDKELEKKDLKIGLVLSGGGAKGFAHIGVLKILEETGVRIDYIGGTSMGAIIGALYASGYNAKELDSLIKSYDFNDLMQDKLPRRTKSIYQKENTEKYALTLPIKKGSVGLPSALSKGQNVFNLLSKLTEHVHGIQDFSQLPIPFFCIATNLETGRQEILEKGFLPEAIKASGAFPTLLDPVEVNGKLLVDGGIVNNFPADIMRQKDVDLIIGVDVQDQLKVKGNLDSAPKIIMQIVNFQMYDDLETKKAKVDLYMHPDITGFSVVSFDDKEQIINQGEVIAKKHTDYLKELANKQKQNNTIIKGGTIRLKRKNLEIDNAIIIGAKNYTRDYILGKIGIRKGEKLTYDDFTKGLNQLAATGNFKSIQYKFLDYKTVEFKLKESDETTFLQLAAHYDDLFKTSALINITSKHLLFKNDVFSADLILGDNIRYNLDFFIDNGFRWSYGINSSHNRFEKSIFRGTFENLPANTANSKDLTKYNDFTTQFFVQTAFSNDLAIRFGAEAKYLRVFTEFITNNQTSKNFYDNDTYGNAFAEIIYDTYDRTFFPKKGFFLNVNYKGYLLLIDNQIKQRNFNPFTQLKGKLGVAYTFKDKLTAHFTSEAGITIGNNNNKVHNFHLGGNNENFINNFTNFYGYDVGDLSGEGYLKSALMLRYELFKDNYFSLTANAARAESDIFNQGALFDNTKLGYAVGYSLDSFLGPVEVKYTWSPDTEQDFWFFNVGFWF